MRACPRKERTKREREWRYEVYLTAHGPMKLQCAKVLQRIVPGFGLGDALLFAGGKMPAVVLSNATYNRARNVRTHLLKIGATASIRSTATSRPALKAEKRTKTARYRIRASGATEDFTRHSMQCEVLTRSLRSSRANGNPDHSNCDCVCHTL